MTKPMTLLTILLIVSLGAGTLPARAASMAGSHTLESDATNALETLYESSPKAAALGKDAKAILVFPKVMKAGFMLGVSYGEGVLIEDGKAVKHYSTKSGSWGPQAGVQRYGYALFLMSDDAVAYLDRSKGWEIGGGPSIVIVDMGRAAKLSSTTIKSDAYAFIFGQRGLMAGLGIEGSKIAAID